MVFGCDEAKGVTKASPSVLFEHELTLPLLPDQRRLLSSERRNRPANVLVARDQQHARAPFGAHARVDVLRRHPLICNRGSVTIRRSTASTAVSVAVPARAAPDTGVAALVPLPLWEGKFFLGSDLVQPVIVDAF